MKIQLYRIGADVEFVVAEEEGKGNWRVVPMNTIFGGRERILDTYIGTDAHAATGEIRPPPAHNIQTILFKVGYALSAIDRHIEASHAGRRRIFGNPYSFNEPLGGHIHVSFFSIHEGNFGFTIFDENYIAEVRERSQRNEIPTAPVIGRILSYFLLPYEYWIQPWKKRARRMEQYGHTGDALRQGGTASPRELREHEKYYHYEYRVPSTWVIHPAIAYGYLALTKLALLNAKTIAPLALKPYTQDTRSDAVPGNLEMRELLLSRLYGTTFRYSSDLQQLRRILDTCETLREQVWNDGGICKIGAWRELL